MLGVVGFDTSVPAVIADLVRSSVLTDGDQKRFKGARRQISNSRRGESLRPAISLALAKPEDRQN